MLWLKCRPWRPLLLSFLISSGTTQAKFKTEKIKIQWQKNKQALNLSLQISEDYGLPSFDYSSRSLHEGALGFGWCTPVDFHLTQQRNAEYKVDFCNQPQSVKFFLKNKNLFYITLSQTKTQLVFDEQFHLIQVTTKNYKLSHPSGSLNQWIVEFTNTAINNKTLIQMDSENSKIIKISRENRNSNRSSMETYFEYKNQRLWKIKKQDQKIIFEFNDVENLISLAPSKAESIFFEYDQERDIYIKSNTQKIGGFQYEE